MAKLIEQTYGQALYELAVEEDKTELFLEEARTLKAAFADGDDFMRFIKNPRVTQDEKRGVLESALRGSVSDEMLGFLVILNQKDRLAKVDGILDFFITKVMAREGIGRAFVSSAAELTTAQKASVREKLIATTGFREIDIDYTIDSSLIGGLVIRVGDRVVDGSIRTRLGALKKELLQTR